MTAKTEDALPRRPSYDPKHFSLERKAIEAERERRRQESLAEALAEYLSRGTPTAGDIASVQRDALQTLERWRSFTRSKPRLLELARRQVLDWREIDELCAIIDRTNREAAEMAGTVRKAKPAGVDWPDAVVVVGIRLLTALDADRARDPNKVGWSRSTSPGGHWATAMLDVDPALAIKLGRTLLAKHLRQLKHIDPAQTGGRSGR
jgi:hypothetical protein